MKSKIQLAARNLLPAGGDKFQFPSDRRSAGKWTQFDPVPFGFKWSKEVRHRSQALSLYKNAQSAQMKIERILAFRSLEVSDNNAQRFIKTK
jgi:hypothetical protein